MNEEEFDHLLDAPSLGAPRVSAVRANGIIPEDVRVRLDAACFTHHPGWLLRISVCGPVPDPTKVHIFDGVTTPCYAYQGRASRLATPLVFHPPTTRPTCDTCRSWEYAPHYGGATLLHRGAARMVNEALSGGDAALAKTALVLLAAPVALEPFAALLAQADGCST